MQNNSHLTKEELIIKVNQLETKLSKLEVSLETSSKHQTEDFLIESNQFLDFISQKTNVNLEVDIDSLELSEIIDIEVMQSIMSDFYDITGMVGAIVDVKGNILVSVGWQDICTKFHRCNPDTLKNCVESDVVLTKNVPKGTFKAYKCKNNLWDIVTPIIIGDKHVGNVFMGQYLLNNEKVDIELFKKQAKKYGFDEDEYLSALKRVPNFNKETIESGMKFYSKLAVLISTLSFNSLQQAKLLNEKKQYEIELRKSEEKYRDLINLTQEGIWVINENNITSFVNPSIEKMLGYSVNEMIGKPLVDFMDITVAEEINSCLKQTNIELNEQDDFEFICKSGNRIFCNISTAPIFNKDNNYEGAIIGIINVTKRKKAEQLLLKNKNRLDYALNAIKTGAWELDLETFESWRSLKHDQIFGYNEPIPEWTFNDFLDHVHPIDRDEVNEKFQNAVKTNTDWDFECRIQHKNSGEIRWIWASGNQDENGKKMFGIVQDITKNKLAAEKHRNQEKNLKNTFDISPSIIARGDATKKRFIEVNKAVTRILGYSIEEFTSKNIDDFIHPDDRQRTQNEILKQLKGNKTYSFENRYLCKDGSYKWISWHSTKANEQGIVTLNGSDISQQKIIEQEIIKTKQFYEDITEGVQDGIIVTDENDFVYYINSAMEKISGASRDQIQGKNLLNGFLKDNIEEFNKYYKKAKKSKKPTWFEAKVITPAQRETWQNGWILPQYKDDVFTGVICTIRDISIRRKAEVDILKLSTAVQQNPAVVFITDTQGFIEYVNPKFTEITGFTNSDVLGKHSNIMKSGMQDALFYKELWDTVKSGNIWKGQFQNRKKNGELFWESASISTILNESGEVINYIKIAEDITQQKLIEKQLNTALEKALESDRLKSAFLSNMSHEIRTPMNGILGFINLLNEPNLSKSKIGEYSAIINKSGERLLNTINDIIDIAKIEAGEVVISTSEVSVEAQIQELYAFFLPEAKEKGLTFSVKTSNKIKDLTIVTDGHKLHGILTNLIKNALKFTEKGEISLGYYLKENTIEFQVKDTGIGIPKNRINCIFNRFEQADIEDSRVFEGSGLGLAITKAYITMLGGEIFVQSTEGNGSTFTFSLPHTQKTTEEAVLTQNTIEYGKSTIKNLNLLIVEDDTVSSYFLETILKDDFLNITIVENGIEAIAYCKNNPDIDLILMDIKMPLMNGYDATKEIRKFNKDVLIIAQTAYAMSGDKEKALEIGCNDYVVKPINKELLFQTIEKLLVE
ncbi:PAS domain S-box protein [Lutibacter holmesii]|uniref:histidine kinase n=1 Tax=Lutibacter holmesii TaxID=1137985 RepID=A0ABW3WP27_9FLAO